MKEYQVILKVGRSKWSQIEVNLSEVRSKLKTIFSKQNQNLSFSQSLFILFKKASIKFYSLMWARKKPREKMF